MGDSESITTRLARKRTQRLRRRNYLELPERLSEAQLQALEQNQRLTRSLQERESNYLRLAADFDNFRKRVNREKQHLILFATEDLVNELLPVIDNFERALAALRTATDVGIISSGMEMIYKTFVSVLHNAGLRPIKTENAFFDPQVHEALSTDERPDVEDNRITQELLRGYVFRGRVLRPALVRVNKIKHVAAAGSPAAETATRQSQKDQLIERQPDGAKDAQRFSEPDVQEMPDQLQQP
jgi:molecular chaperone GrpE